MADSNDDNLKNQYMRAMLIRTDSDFENLAELEEKMLADIRAEEDPKRCNAIVQAHRIIIDNKKWELAKRRPERFSDRMVVAGDKEAPLTINFAVPPMPTLVQPEPSKPPTEAGK
jgi:hypothetical protein